MGGRNREDKKDTRIMRSVRIGFLPRDEPENEGRKKVILSGIEDVEFHLRFHFNPDFNMTVGSTANSVR